MTRYFPQEWTTDHWFYLGALAVFAAAVLPPVLWLVNATPIIGNYPVLYVWAAIWGVLGTYLLYRLTRREFFGIGEDQVPPDIPDHLASAPAETGTDQSVTATGSQD